MISIWGKQVQFITSNNLHSARNIVLKRNKHSTVLFSFKMHYSHLFPRKTLHILCHQPFKSNKEIIMLAFSCHKYEKNTFIFSYVDIKQVRGLNWISYKTDHFCCHYADQLHIIYSFTEQLELLFTPWDQCHIEIYDSTFGCTFRCIIAFNAFQATAGEIEMRETKSILRHALNFKMLENMSITIPLNSCRCDSWCILMTVVFIFRCRIAVDNVGTAFECIQNGYSDCLIKSNDDERIDAITSLIWIITIIMRPALRIKYTLFHCTDDVATLLYSVRSAIQTQYATNTHNFNINLFIHGMLQRLPFSFFVFSPCFRCREKKKKKKMLNDDKHSDSLFIIISRCGVHTVSNRFRLRIRSFFHSFGWVHLVVASSPLLASRTNSMLD